MQVKYGEYHDSQAPALTLLQKMGWTYISPEETINQRDGLLSNVILEDILAERLHAINTFEYKGDPYKFSQSNIQSAITALKNVPEGGLIATNEKVYDLITLGKSYSETINGDKKSFSLRYIDWLHPENNSYHVTEEFVVEGIKEKRRPDLVLFVNGIPFVVIENKRRDKNDSIEEAVSQNIRNQKTETGTPRLFHYAQLLLAVHPNEVKYATTGTPAKFWSVWKEDNEKAVQSVISSEINDLPGEDRLATAQDCGLMSLCSPQRVMDLSYKYIVFDGPIKKVCRYQQYFAVQDTLKQVTQFDTQEKRKGGVIWHTTGSGKSLTMVMLSKALALEKSIDSPRVIVVTDRKSLDKQIFKTFVNCGKNVKKAKSGNDLADLLKDKGNEVITTIIDKFRGASKSAYVDHSSNVFVLVDESHRSQYGSANLIMRKLLPNACFIGFTGTPLLKSEKNTARKFGGFIHKYTIDQAVKDGAVLPLLYEGRSAKLTINKKQIDKGFERLAAPLSEEAQKDLKRKFASISKIYESDHVVEEIAYDISKHFCENWQGTGFKAQLATPKIDTAIKYQRYFENQTNPNLKINTAVVFTPPDSRQDNEDVWSESSNESKIYWDSLMERYQGQEVYENWVIDHFKEKGNEVELVIVVTKLLTGFDAPRNTVLYLAKPLHSHNLLQAIARVNRLFEGKEHGHIIDYVGILGKLDEALTDYSAFEDYDAEDITNAVIDVREEVRKVPLRHSDVIDIFKEVQNKEDIEALERHLSPKDIRDSFYERVSAFARVLQTALSSDEFYQEYTEAQIAFYKGELKRFQSLRRSVQVRYAEVISYKEYEPRVKKLLDTYVDAERVDQITSGVNIFDKNQVNEALASYGKTTASKADYIANNMKKVINENMDRDEAFYKKFSEMIEDTIRAFQEGRLSEKEYLETIMKTRDDMEKGHQEGIPNILQDKPKARAFFGALNDVIKDVHGNGSVPGIAEQLAKAGIDISEIVENLTIRDWKRNLDVQRQMENEIEDYLIDHRSTLGIELTFDEIDIILAKCLKIAKHNF
ncbi:type I restriction endonuclease subunit R [Robertkochia solimangrovi]|uniref:type I restriction endonuclease subunit R n=1 Tax=Robertkochia solimangrovi TaxID=2213046 RepID=UPI00117F83CA|nr:HsdR family type I site-specific deoxyribonuclease [Robertkochia solimangrovi]TRZ41671.1 type I restriction endonuclease subunit R [Robertkochia solimangrovi]